MKNLLCMLCIFGVVMGMRGQENITIGTPYIQNFNSLGASPTAALPPNWKAQKNDATVRDINFNFSTGVTAVEKEGGNNISNTATNGIYRFNANSNTSESALGGLSSGTYSKTVVFMIHCRNNSLNSISSLDVSYNVEKYRNGSNSAGFSIEMFYSTDGATWTSCGSNFTTSFSQDGNNNGFNPSPGTSINVNNTFTPTQPILSNSPFYLAWRYSVTSGTTTSNAQALGIDDISITANTISTPTITATPSTLSGFSYVFGSGPSAEQTINVSGSNLTDNITITPPTDYEISTTSGSGYVSTPITLFQSSGSVSNTTIYIRLKSGLSVATYNSQNISLTSTGATTVNVSCSGSVTAPTASVTFSSSSSSIAENATTPLSIPVVLSSYPGAPVVINVATSGTAVLNTDYTINTNSLTFSANGTQNIEITPIDNSLYAANKTVVLTLTIGSGSAVIDTAVHTASIVENDIYPYTNILSFDFVGYSGSEMSGTSNENNSNLNSSTITRNNLTAPTNNDRFNATSFGTVSISDEVSNNRYFTFTLTPKPGAQVLIDKINFNIQRSSTGPSAIALRSSIDGFSSNIDGEKTILDNTTTQSFTFNVGQTSYNTSTIVFRIYMYAEATTGTGGFEGNGNDIEVIGDAKCIQSSITSSNGSGLIEQCTENGWTYYGNSGTRVFAIQKNGNTLDATVTITENSAPIVSSMGQNGANLQHQMFLLPKYWDVTSTTLIGSNPMKVRFYYGDTSATMTARDNAYSAIVGTQSVKSPYLEWFKTIGTPMNASFVSGIMGNIFPSAVQKLTPTYGSEYGVDYVEFSGITSFSGGTGGFSFGPPNSGGATSLPVTWGTFEVNPTEGGNQLVWYTESEQNTSDFVVEYSYDAQRFIPLPGRIAAAGNSSSRKSYSYLHTDYSPTVYYRILQRDLDQKISYSSIRVAKRHAVEQLSVVAYPQPMTSDLLRLRMSTVDLSPIAISIVDLMGREVLMERVEPTQTKFEHNLNLQQLTAGSYILRVSHHSGAIDTRIIR